MSESERFERWRGPVVAGLIFAGVLIVAYWVAWAVDRDLVASRTTSAYYSFEDGFVLADAWLLIAVTAAAVQLARRRPSALLWLIAAGGAGVYLLAMDVLYDLRHGIYARGRGGLIELVIDLLLLVGSTGVLAWSWRYRESVLGRR